MIDQNQNFFKLPKRSRKVSLSKRTSITNLHQSSQNSVNKVDLTDRRQMQNSKPKLVTNQIKIDINGQILQEPNSTEPVLKRIDHILHIKELLILSKAKNLKSSNIIIQNSYSFEKKFEDFQIIQMFNRFQKTKLDLDDIYICLANIKKQEKTIIEPSQAIKNQIKEVKHEIVSKQLIPENNVTKNFTPNQIQRKKTLEQEIQTARFNQQQYMKKQFKELQSIKTIQLNSPKTLSMTGQNSDFYKQKSDMKIQEISFKQNCKAIKSLLCFKMNPMEQKFLEQILNFGIYKNQSQNFYGIRIYQIDTNQIVSLLSQPRVIEIFKYVEAIRIFKSEYHLCLNQFFTQSLKIINLSQNNLTTISFLKNCPDLQFVNLNHNRIKNLNTLRDLKNLVEIHAFDNFIQHPFLSHTFTKLNIFDIGYNQICDIQSLVILKNVLTLKVLNVIGNPLEKKNGFKKQISRYFPQIKGFQFPEASIFSDYNRYKDITFFTQAEKKVALKNDKKKRESKENIRKN